MSCRTCRVSVFSRIIGDSGRHTQVLFNKSAARTAFSHKKELIIVIRAFLESADDSDLSRGDQVDDLAMWNAFVREELLVSVGIPG